MRSTTRAVVPVPDEAAGLSVAQKPQSRLGRRESQDVFVRRLLGVEMVGSGWKIHRATTGDDDGVDQGLQGHLVGRAIRRRVTGLHSEVQDVIHADLFSRVYGSQFLALEKQELSAKQAQQGALADG